jgi:hypothetical protein
MSDYRVADGSDVVLGSLTVLSPQPRSTGIEYTRRSYAADSTPILEGPFINLVWDVLGSKTEYQAILTTFGLSSATTNDVTVYIRNANFDYVRMNGKAIKPQIGEGIEWANYFPRNMTILIRDLETAA